MPQERRSRVACGCTSGQLVVCSSGTILSTVQYSTAYSKFGLTPLPPADKLARVFAY
jgi:hypothetical protein